MAENLDYIEMNPMSDPIASVIWMHGLGADGHDFETIVPELNLPSESPIRFIFPHAPMRPVTLNNGYVMRAWYDIPQMNIREEQDEQGIKASAQLITQLIEQEKKQGLKSEQIILAGFSQGGAMALYTGLRYPEKLGGILALSTYLPLDQKLDEFSAVNRAIPIMMAHGTMDPLIPLSFAELSRDLLVKAGYQVDWHTYPMQHSVCPQEIQDISAWFQRYSVILRDDGAKE